MKVLFVGNSFTFYNEMPKIAEAVAASAGCELTTGMVAFGGHFLHQYAAFDEEKGKIFLDTLRSEKWDAVVLQDHSYNPALHFDDFRDSVKTLVGKIREETDAAIYLYHTWAYDRVAPKLAKTALTYEELDARLRGAYESVAVDMKIGRVPVGDGFRDVYNGDSGIYMFATKDNYHPSYAGSYLAACAFCYTFFGKRIAITYSGELTKKASRVLRAEAKKIVL